MFEKGKQKQLDEPKQYARLHVPNIQTLEFREAHWLQLNRGFRFVHRLVIQSQLNESVLRSSKAG
jgi:hypothetical protein